MLRASLVATIAVLALALWATWFTNRDASALAPPASPSARLDVTPATTLLFTEVAGVHTAEPIAYGQTYTTITCNAPGAGTSWDWELTSRNCDAVGSCGDWEATPLGNGSVADTDTLEVTTLKPRWQYQLVITETAGAPEVRCWMLLRN